MVLCAATAARNKLNEVARRWVGLRLFYKLLVIGACTGTTSLEFNKTSQRFIEMHFEHIFYEHRDIKQKCFDCSE